MTPPVKLTGWQYHINLHWPAFLIKFGGGTILLFIILIFSLQFSQWGVALLIFAVILVVAYFFGAALWAASKIYGEPDYFTLFEMGNLRPTTSFTIIELGWKNAGIALHRRLTQGIITVIDVYNAELTPGSIHRRARKLYSHPSPDPRLIWQDGSIDLLGLADESVPAVMMPHVLAAFWQAGDQQKILQQIYRILLPGGYILMSERTRTVSNWLVLGLKARGLMPASYWHNLLAENGFRSIQEQRQNDLTTCFRARKPTRTEGKQLIFDFGV